MSRLLNLVLVLVLIAPGSTFADCDFATGIEKLPDGRYAYSVDCHKKVGKMVQDEEDRKVQVEALTKTITLKDLMLDTQEKRVEMWQNTALKQEERVNTIERMNDTNKVLYFVGGVVFTGLAVWAAGQLAR